MRASRLLQLLLLLQARGRMTAPQLAEELEVSVRTVYRDLEALSAAGVPVYTETGRYGGAQLVDGWRTRLTGLTGDEAETLPLLGMPAAAAELGLGTVLAATQLKVLAALPPELRSRAARVQERFLLDAPGWFRRDEQLPCLADIATAVWGDRRIRITYARVDRTVERVIEPLGLVLKAGTWYLVATTDGSSRTYRVSRVESVERLDEPFDRPEGFDLAARWAASSDDFERSTQQVEVALRMRAGDVQVLRHVLTPSARERLVTTDLGDAWVEVRFPSEGVQVAERDVLVLGSLAEVLAPVELRERIASVARRTAALYDESPSAPERASTSRAATAR